MATLDTLPAPTADNVGTQVITTDGNALVVVDVGPTGTPIYVWNQEVVRIGRRELDFPTGTDLTSGRVVTLTADNELTTSLQGSLSRAGVIFSELVVGASVAHPQDGYEYFVYDVSLLLGEATGTTFVTRGLVGNREEFFMGAEGGGVDPDTMVAVAPYYTFNF